MPHPGFGFTRRSFHTLKSLGCPRKAYLTQMLEIRRRSQTGMASGPMAAGSIFHTLLEVHYTPAKFRGQPLPGTDGNPAGLVDADTVRDWYLSSGFDPEAVCEALDAYSRYVMDRGEDAEVASRLVGRPEPNVEGDLRDLFANGKPNRSIKIPYAAQYDAVIRNPTDGPKGVIAVEHKLLAYFQPNTVRSYLSSGQLIGQCAVWNSRSDLVEKYGPMEQVMLNLAFKRPSKTNPIHTHRAILFIPRQWQLDYARAVEAATRKLAGLLREDKRSQKTMNPKGAAGWPQSGIVNGECVQLTHSCEFLDVCQSGSVEPEFYQITENGRERGTRETALQVSRHLEGYTK